MEATTYILAIMAICAGFASIDAQNCYTCASTELKSRWQLIGYPSKLADEYFTDNCDATQVDTKVDPTDPQKQKTIPGDKRTTCSTQCVVVAVKGFDSSGTPLPAVNWAIRGCYDTLMGASSRKAQTTLTTASNKKLEYGDVMFFNNKSEEAKSSMAIKACKVDATNTLCNDDAASTLFACKSGDEAWCSTPQASQTCRVSSWAKSSEQSGQHCTKSSVSINGWWTTTRGYSAVNPLVPPGSKYPDDKDGKGYLCVYYQDGLYSPPGGYSQVSSTTCYCNDQKYCNGGNRLRGLSLSVLAILPLVIAFFKA